MKRNIGEKIVLVGRVSKVDRKNEKLVVVGMNVSTKKDDPAWENVAVFNGNKFAAADNIEKNVQKGDFIAVIAEEKENGEYKNLTAYSVLYGNGKSDLGENKYLLNGRVGKVTRKNENLVVIGINVSNKKDEAVWENVAIFNSDKVKLADLCEKYLEPGQKVAMIVHEKENGQYKNLTAENVEFGPKAKRAA